MRPRNHEAAVCRPKMTVVRDTREKVDQGWTFPLSDACAGTIVKKLDTGDYSLLGFENLITIERKGCVAEFCGNLTQARFIGKYDPHKSLAEQSEIVRLEQITWPFILLEFTIEDLIKYPNLLEIPPRLRKTIRFRGFAALKKVVELQMKYKTKIIFCGKKGKDVAASIFKRVAEEIVKSIPTK